MRTTLCAGLFGLLASVALAYDAADYIAAPMDDATIGSYARSKNYTNFQTLVDTAIAEGKGDADYTPPTSLDNRAYLGYGERNVESWAASALDCLEIALNKGVTPSTHSEHCYYNGYIYKKSTPVKLNCTNLGDMDNYTCSNLGNLWRAAAYLVSGRAKITGSDGKSYHVLDYRVLPARPDVATNNALKRAIMRFGAISVPFHYPLSDSDTTPNMIGTALGWDATGFIVRIYNCGISYVTVPYANRSFAMSTHVMAYPAPAVVGENDLMQQYDYFGPMASRGSSVSGSFQQNYGPTVANVFTAPARCTLDGFGFYTGDVSVQIDYTVCVNPLATDTLKMTNSVTSGSFEINNWGYDLESYGWFYVKLPTPVTLNRGDTYAISVLFKDYSNGHAMGLERTESYAAPTSAAHESYVGYSSDSLFDLTKGQNWYNYLESGDSNVHVCLKAYLTQKEGLPITIENCTTWAAYTNAVLRNATYTDSSLTPATCTPETTSPGSSGKGKFHANGTPMTIYDEFVMGTDPTDDSSKFTASIEMVDGLPQITWSPALNGEGVPTGIRTYTTYGANELNSGWTPIDADNPASSFKFFQGRHHPAVITNSIALVLP